MSDTGSMVGHAAERRLIPREWFYGGLLGLLLLFCIALGPIENGLKEALHNVAMQQCRAMGQAMFSYATDNVQNGNAYPDGKSSTEVFQKLLDGH